MIAVFLQRDIFLCLLILGAVIKMGMISYSLEVMITVSAFIARAFQAVAKDAMT